MTTMTARRQVEVSLVLVPMLVLVPVQALELVPVQVLSTHYWVPQTATNSQSTIGTVERADAKHRGCGC